jgi:hypothetical protein
MTINNIDVDATIEQVKTLLAQEKDLSPAVKSSLEVLLLLVTLLANRFGLNSKNSSKPPSADPNREKQSRAKSNRKPGGQPGRRGTTLQPVADPDEIEVLQLDRRTLPAGNYREIGYESRQVVDLDISRIVTEYRARILEDERGNRHVAPFPEGVTRAVQYGIGVKVNAVYMSQFQLLPYNRIGDHFWEQMQVYAEMESPLGQIHIERLSPSEKTFADFAIDGVIPNDNLMYRSSTSGSESQTSIQNANILHIRVTLLVSFVCSVGEPADVQHLHLRPVIGGRSDVPLGKRPGVPCG